jgi:hypothetical protein
MVSYKEKGRDRRIYIVRKELTWPNNDDLYVTALHWDSIQNYGSMQNGIMWHHYSSLAFLIRQHLESHLLTVQ